MEDHAREARSHALSLLKKKLHQSGRRRARVAVDNTQNEGSLQAEEAVDPHKTSNQEEEHQLQAAHTIPLQQPPIEPKRNAAPEAMPLPFDVPLQHRKPIKKLVVKWSCTTCKRECIPIREESRCLCGHRYKEHPSSHDDPRIAKNKALTAAAFSPFACTSTKCPCKAFFYVVAEGAWILRCRCKHKHTDHDASGKPFSCRKPQCKCDGFDSPWVCNCDHPWNDHVQETVEKEFKPLELFHDQFHLADLSNVQRTDLVREPMRRG